MKSGIIISGAKKTKKRRYIQMEIKFPIPGKKSNYPENVAWSQEYQDYLDKQDLIKKSKENNPQWVLSQKKKKEAEAKEYNRIFKNKNQN